MIASQPASSISRKCFSSAMPALLTSTSMPAPALVRGGDRRVDRVRVADVGRVQPGLPSARLDLDRDRLQRLAPAADQHHVGTLGGEPLGDCEPDPLTGSGDDDVLSLEAARCHGAPLT